MADNPVFRAALVEINDQLNRHPYDNGERVGAVQALATLAVAEALDKLVSEIYHLRQTIQNKPSWS